jgi:glycosyltransferase involved in cell wall biosynthesis
MMANLGAPPLVCVLESLAPAARRALARHTLKGVEIEVCPASDRLGEIAGGAAGDVVFLAGGAVVSEGWLGRLADAARTDSTVNSAVALEDGDAELAGTLAVDSAQVRPRIVPRPSLCVYVARPVLDQARGLDPEFQSPFAQLTDLLRRALLAGSQHVLADDVLVAGPPVVLPEADTRLLAERHPWAEAEGESRSPGLARSLAALRRAERGLDITLDLREMGAELSGTQVHLLEVVGALALRAEGRLRLLVSEARLGGEPRRLLESLSDVELLPDAALSDAQTPKTVVAHRPVQVALPEDVDVLRALGERIVITQQDLIAYRTPAYHATPELWRQYRRATRLALAMSDAAVFFSRHALEDALADDLINPQRAEVIAIAAEHSITEAGGGARPPQRMRELGPDGFLVCLGNDFRHKNRPFAIRLLQALRDRGWRGGLVLAGARMTHGSSEEEEQSMLRGRPELEAVLLRLGPVEEAEKAWLYANAAAVLYPTTYEGFGLLPFEAGEAGVPCLFAPVAALAELLPAEAAVLVPWDAQASAERALPLLSNTSERAMHVELLRRSLSGLPSWDDHAAALLALYERAAASPEREARVLAAQAVEAERELYDRNRLLAEIGESVSLVSPSGYLPPDIQRALLSIVTRPRLREPFFTALRGLYRAGHRARRRGG